MVKPYSISKHLVMEAYRKVKKNDGAAGVDGQSIKEFEKDLKNNLYKIWNRMSSGSYQPPPVKLEEIPKSDGKIRKLGIPTVSDRIAQMVVKIYLEPSLEKIFHKNSYGYRPNKSAIQAVGEARKNCWKYNWVIDLDIKGFFDNIDHELMMRAVEKHSKDPWVRLYVKRWLQAPIQTKEGKIEKRALGTPQGGVISPLIANLFLHYAFDDWMKRNHPKIQFERYADDMIIHCNTENEAKRLLEAIRKRFLECKLELHPEKTKIVYCKDANRKEDYPNQKFDFLGYTFRPRSSRNWKGQLFTNFSPAMSDKAIKKSKEEIREWKKENKPNCNIEEIAKNINPIIYGWINYYGKFHASQLWKIVHNIQFFLMRWIKKKYAKLKNHWKKAYRWLTGIKIRMPKLFAHWQWMERNGYGNGRAV